MEAVWGKNCFRSLNQQHGHRKVQVEKKDNNTTHLHVGLSKVNEIPSAPATLMVVFITIIALPLGNLPLIVGKAVPKMFSDGYNCHSE